MTVDLKTLRRGDILTYSHDSGARGPVTCYAKVVKVSSTQVKVQGEYGGMAWKSPSFFERRLPEHMTPHLNLEEKIR